MNIREAESALSYLSPDADRHEWWTILAALKSEFGDEARHIAESWSAQSGKFSPYGFKSTWRSTRADGGVTIATLCSKAMQAGWRPESGNRSVRIRPSPEKILYAECFVMIALADFEQRIPIRETDELTDAIKLVKSWSQHPGAIDALTHLQPVVAAIAVDNYAQSCTAHGKPLSEKMTARHIDALCVLLGRNNPLQESE